jgi:predicted nucleotidyltransferase
MRRDEVIEQLKQHEADIRALGAASLYLYGSHARDEAREDSDVDLFFDRDPNKRISLMELIELKFLAEQILGTEVDIGTRTSLHPVLKPEIERNALRIF